MVRSYITIIFRVSSNDRYVIESEGQVWIEDPASDGFSKVFSYDTQGIKTFSITSTGDHAIYEGNYVDSGGNNVGSLGGTNGQYPTIVRLMSSPETNNYNVESNPYNISEEKYGGVSPWSFISDAEGGVECGVYVGRSDTYVKYKETPYVAASGRGSTLFISTDIVGDDSTIGILLPSQFILLDLNRVAIPPYFSIVSSSSYIHSNTLAYSRVVDDKMVTTRFNASTGDTFVYMNTVAVFYLVTRKRYTVRYDEAHRGIGAALHTVKVLQQILNGSVRGQDGKIFLSNSLVRGPGIPVPVLI